MPPSFPSSTARTLRRAILCLVLAGLLALVVMTAYAQALQPPLPGSPLEEVQTVYLGNVARRQNGLPPLRWNAELTNAARWFSWDSVEHRPEPYCGHEDSEGHWPDYRARAAGYYGSSGAENAFCGYVTPQQAIDGWMNSPGHRANLLDPNSREIGLGYYLRTADGRGYVTQDFGHDPAYAPVIIDDEAVSTFSTQVQLYLYDHEEGGGFAGLGPAVDMAVSNDRCFSDAGWEPFAHEREWTLRNATGWQSVFVRTRDRFGRTLSASDAIYVGDAPSGSEITAGQMSSSQPDVTLYNLQTAPLPTVQFSPGWLADDSFETFSLLWGSGERVADPAALGGSAFELGPPGEYTESCAWVWTTEFPHDVPLVAYARLKAGKVGGAADLVRVSVTGGETRTLRELDFKAANQYQEFPLRFTFITSETFLIFRFCSPGATPVYVDAVSIFTAGQPVSSTVTWAYPGGNYRGQGVWVRYADDAGNFTEMAPGQTQPSGLSVNPIALSFTALAGRPAPGSQVLTVGHPCGEFAWQSTADVAWIRMEVEGDRVSVVADPQGLAPGTHTGKVKISPVGAAGVGPVEVPVRLILADHAVYLPGVQR